MRLVKYQNEANIKSIMLKLTKTKKIVMEHNLSLLRHSVCLNYFKKLGNNMLEGQER